jgi:hypothetical protein
MDAVASLKRLTVVCALLGTVACAAASPTAPTSPAPTPANGGSAATATLTVRVLARQSELPIPGAHILTGSAQGSTDASGLCLLSIPTGAEVDVEVSADGYQPMGATGTLGNDERWTFYLPAAN